MKRRILTTALAFVLALSCGSAALAQDGDDGGIGRIPNPGDNPGDRRAQTTMKFLGISLDARTASMGDAAMAQEIGSTSMFYNPAGMARLEGLAHVSVGQVQWIGDFNYSFASAAVSLAGGRYGVAGFSVRSGDYGEFIGTVRDGSDPSGFRETGTFSPTTLALGVSYAHALTDQFSIGTNIKYAMQDLSTTIVNEAGDTQANKESAIVADLGMLYKTGFRSLNFAAAVRNFSREVRYVNKQVELPLMLQIGVSMDVTDLLSGWNQNMHALRMSLDASRPRDYATNVKFGGEYLFMNTLALRAGYEYPQQDEQGASLGAGLQWAFGGIDLQADYAYTTYDVFDNVNRISLQFGF